MYRWVYRAGKHVLANYPGLWRTLSADPWVRGHINRFFINHVASASRPRPHPLSLGTDYSSWSGLVDRTWTGRHLPPAEQSYVDSLPKIDDPRLRALFARKGDMLPCPKSSALFGFFAQWFTDSFLRTDPVDVRKNTSNHEIDLCQIYGLNAADTRFIRGDGKRGQLEFQTIDGEEYPPYLFEAGGKEVKAKYLDLSYIDKDKKDFKRVDQVIPEGFNKPERKEKFFVTGLERGNSTILYSALNTIFLREHNRLCRELAKFYPGWDDERLFETARNINIAQLIKIIVEDYINHLSPAQFKLFMEVGFAEKKNWYRTNRICAEFNLLYRWHQLVPTKLKLEGQEIADPEFRFKNDLLLSKGVEALVDAASTQAGGRISLRNTAAFLVDADLAALAKSRSWRVQSYTSYLAAFGVPAVHSFSQLTDDPALAAALKELYVTVDRVEYPIGLLAERRTEKSMLGDLMTAMVGVDAFSQALTNPLLSRNVFGNECFSPDGVASIRLTSSLADVVRRNSRMEGKAVSFALRKVPGSYGLPFIGWLTDTIAAFWNVQKFFRGRQEQHGGSTVFRIHMMQPTIAMLDHRAISSLFSSTDLVQDKPSHGFQFQVPPLPLVGNVAPSMYGDGDDHDVPKQVYQALLRKRAGTLVPVFQQTLREFTGRWLNKQPFSFSDQIEDFVVTFVFRWILGDSPAPGEVRVLYNNIFSHFAIPLTREIPFSGFRRSKAIYGRLLEFVKTSPNFREIAELARKEKFTDEEALAKHLCFVLGMNSFLGNQSLLKSCVGELSLRPALRDALRQEMSDPNQPLLDRTLREILRLHPPVFFIYGRATRDRVIESAQGEFTVAAGELVLGVIPMAQRDPRVFDKPEAFNPDRFKDDPRASAHLIWPRGVHDDAVTPQGRTCPGKDVALLIGKLFCVEMLQNYEWELKEQPTWSWRFTLNVAAPTGKLMVARFRRRVDNVSVKADASPRPPASRAMAR